MKVYRNIYFYGSEIKLNGEGSIDIEYTGLIFNNARFIKNFNDEYDSELDLLIICEDCAHKKFRSITKKK